MADPIYLLPWLVLLLPLISAGTITVFTLRDREMSARLSISAVVVGFLLSVVFIAVEGWEPARRELILNWLEVGPLQVDFGLRLDPLSLMMMLVVTGVGGAIHLYSRGYLREDPGYARYFACLSLFTFSMLCIVLATNFIQLFIGWELVGVSSYLLIGFWFQRPAAADAAKKALLTNRVGDFGFLLGILMVWALLGSLNFGDLEQTLRQNRGALGSAAAVAGLLIFCGAVGKSAQFPLHVWLPDAMEGPTPVSALIHAATMVAAGVYLLCRVFFLLDPQALQVIAWIGGFTALLSALIAVQQDDIKRILAYSTLSQLGYMVMAVGAGGPTPAMYHLTTHAFFKALLFLGAGSVICALHHEQDIWRMGDLRRRMPVTFWTFLLGALALCGVPPLSGFFSKDEILAATLTGPQGNLGLFILGTSVALLTTVYMTRLFLVAFLGSPRSDAARHAKESPAVMTFPLVVLAIASVGGGFLGIPARYAVQLGEPAAGHALVAVVASLGAVILGFGIAFPLYRGVAADPLPERLGALAQAMRNRFYFDELYAKVIRSTQEALSEFLDWFDRWIIAGLVVRGTHGSTDLLGRALRLVQTGNLQTYAFLFALGVALLLYLAIAR